MKSLLRVRHDIDAGSDGVEPWQLKEERPWVRFFDSVLGRIPLIGMLAGYVFNPTYTVRRGDEPIVRIRQRRAWMEGKFTLEQLADLNESEQLRALLSTLTFLLIG